MNVSSYFFYLFIVLSVTGSNVYSEDFSERQNFNKILKGFYKNKIFSCVYISKSWSTGFKDQPYEW